LNKLERAAVIGLVASALTIGATLASSAQISEDDPRWDCRTMGNHICGTPSGNVLYVEIGCGLFIAVPQ